MVKKNKNIIKELTEVSNYFGQRFDLIQAAGGNSSIKNGKSMYIKSSGYSLAELDESNGYSIVDNEILVKHLDYVKNNIPEFINLHKPTRKISYPLTDIPKDIYAFFKSLSNIEIVDKISSLGKEVEYELMSEATNYFLRY